jgi:hypothetical protein
MKDTTIQMQGYMWLLNLFIAGKAKAAGYVNN